jgi:pimeloyl-ACP methyl ester carboxylesterase
MAPVFAPTLTGLGERSHLLTRDVDLDTHITDIVQVLESEDLRDVVLVGHSYAGMVITGVAEKAAARIGQLVSLKGAFILCSQRADFREAAERAKQRGYRYRELLSASHDAMVTQPRELTKILIELV